jgi:hypothetical protein
MATAWSSFMSPQRTDLAASVLSRRACSALSELIDTSDALGRHHDGVAGNRVLGLDLVAPPVGNVGSAGAVRGDFLRDFVAFEHVLERRDLEAHSSARRIIIRISSAR